MLRFLDVSGFDQNGPRMTRTTTKSPKFPGFYRFTILIQVLSNFRLTSLIKMLKSFNKKQIFSSTLDEEMNPVFQMKNISN